MLYGLVSLVCAIWRALVQRPNKKAENFYDLSLPGLSLPLTPRTALLMSEVKIHFFPPPLLGYMLRLRIEIFFPLFFGLYAAAELKAFILQSVTLVVKLNPKPETRNPKP